MFEEAPSSMHMQWISSYRIPFSTLINYVPVVATVVTCFFSIVLARATLRYVEATDKGLALAREEFERECSPDFHIKLDRLSPPQPRFISPNLPNISPFFQP